MAWAFLPALLKGGVAGGVGLSAATHGVENTLRSIFDAPLSAFGAQDEGQFRTWQQQNPFSDMGLQLGAGLGFYTAPYAAARYGAKAGNAFGQKIMQGLNSNRFLDRAGTAIGIETPINLMYATANQQKSPGPFDALEFGSDLFWDSLIAGTAGGIFGGDLNNLIEGFGKPRELSKLAFGGVDRIHPDPNIHFRNTTKKLRTFEDALKRGMPVSDDALAKIKQAQSNASIELRGLHDPKNQKLKRSTVVIDGTPYKNVPEHFTQFADIPGKPSDAANRLNRMLLPGLRKKSKIRVLKWENLSKDGEMRKVLREAFGNRPLDDILAHSFQPRLVTSKKDITDEVADNMHFQDGNLFTSVIRRAATTEDGKKKHLTGVMMRVSDMDGKQRWLKFTTDKPSMINPDLTRLHQDFNDREVLDALGEIDPITKQVDGVEIEVKAKNLSTLIKQVLGGEGIVNFAKEQSAPLFSGFMHSIGKAIDRNLAPKAWQQQNNPVGRMALHVMSEAWDRPRQMVEQMVFGKADFATGNVWRDTAKQDIVRKGGLADLVKNLNDKELRQFNVLLRDSEENGSFLASNVEEALKRGDITPEVAALAKKHIEVFDDVNTELNATAQATGNAPFDLLPGHIGLPREWEGDYRIFLQDSDGNVVDVIAGQTRKEVEQEAGKVAAQKDLTVTPVVRRGEQMDDIELDRKIHKFESDAPLSYLRKHRTDKGGFKERDYNKETYLESAYKALAHKAKHISSMNSRYVLRPIYSKLNILGEHNDLATINDRLKQYEGENISLGNRVDSIIARTIGTTTRSLAVNAGRLNRLESTLRQGFFDIGYATMAVPTYLHTGATVSALLRNGAMNTLSRVMTPLAFKAGNQYTPQADFNWFNSTQMALRDVMNPDEELKEMFRMGLNRQVIDHMAIELGENQMTQKWRKMVDGMFNPKDPIKDSLVAPLSFAANWTLIAPEMASRMIAMSMGRRIAKDMFGITDFKEAYEMAEAITNIAAYRYMVNDRSSIFTGAAGSTMGLFKTWVINTMFAMEMATRGVGEIYNTKGLGKAMMPAVAFTLGNGALGGLLGNPLVGAASSLMPEVLESEHLENFVYANTEELGGHRLGDGILYGLPAAIGWSLHSRTTLPGAQLVRDAQLLTSVIMKDRIEQLSNAAQAMADHTTSGSPETMFANDRVWDAIARGIAPKTVHRAMQLFNDGEFTKDLVSGKTGYPIKRELTWWERAGYMLGFTPMEIETHYRVSEKLWEDNEARRDAVSKFGKAMFDNDGKPEVQDHIIKAAMVQGVPLESLMASWHSRREEAGKDIVQRALQDEQKERFKWFLKRYEQKIQ